IHRTHTAEDLKGTLNGNDTGNQTVEVGHDRPFMCDLIPLDAADRLDGNQEPEGDTERELYWQSDGGGWPKPALHVRLDPVGRGRSIGWQVGSLRVREIGRPRRGRCDQRSCQNRATESARFLRGCRSGASALRVHYAERQGHLRFQSDHFD
ncbi:hypothetical protein EG68_08631, partial [Paragonimus skrjabini miyazakii]